MPPVCYIGAGLESNKVTNADDSEESEDSLPLNVPNMTAPIKKQQQKQATTSPSGAGTFGEHQTSLGSGEHTEGNDGTGDSSPPPIPRFGDSGQRTSAGHDYDEEAGESTELQRTKHGSPHPRKRKDGQGWSIPWISSLYWTFLQHSSLYSIC